MQERLSAVVRSTFRVSDGVHERHLQDASPQDRVNLPRFRQAVSGRPIYAVNAPTCCPRCAHMLAASIPKYIAFPSLIALEAQCCQKLLSEATLSLALNLPQGYCTHCSTALRQPGTTRESKCCTTCWQASPHSQHTCSNNAAIQLCSSLPMPCCNGLSLLFPAQIPRSCSRRETLSTRAEASPSMGWTRHSTCLKPQSVLSNMLESI